jgi:arylsulfatase A-like enzyme
VDTLRADHLSAYGYERETSPYLERLAKESVLFRTAVTAYTKTTPSFAALFTGKPAFATGMSRQSVSYFPNFNFTLAELLKNKGYTTVGLVSNATLTPYCNYDDGFDQYFELWRKRSFKEVTGAYDRADRVTQEGIRWLKQNHSKKFFMWIHYTDPHSPYDAPAPYSDWFMKDAYTDRFADIPIEKIKWQSRLENRSDPDFYIAKYDGEIRFTDEQIRIFLEEVERLGLKRNTLLIFTADHGESMTEHGNYFDHGKFAYETLARVPLMIRYPREISQVNSLSEMVSLIDIFPTVLDFLGLPTPEGVEGRSLKPALTVREEETSFSPAFIESNYQKSLRTGDWKIIWNATNDPDWKKVSNNKTDSFELYHLSQDPEETQNLIGRGLAIEAELKQALGFWMGRLESGAASQRVVATKELDPETLEKLKSLGYIG